MSRSQNKKHIQGCTETKFQNVTSYTQIQGGIVQYQVKAQHRYGGTAVCGA